MQLGVVIGLLFGFAIAFFAFLNTGVVSVNYYFGQVNASVALLVLASAFCGALAVALLGLYTQIKTGFSIWNFQNRLKRLTKEVEELKEQKKALSDDLAFAGAECEMALKEKEQELEHCREAVVHAAATDEPEGESKQHDM